MKKYALGLLLFIANSSAGQNPHPAHYYNPKWSPDGKSIVFESTRDGKSSIYTIRADGTHLQKITDTIYDYGQPDWSPDGKHLVYYGKIKPMQIFINTAQGNGQRELITIKDAYQPAWSVQNKIAFISRSIRQPGFVSPHVISAMNTDGTGLKLLTDTLSDSAAPCWSPDGKQILFVRTLAVNKPWKEITPEEKKRIQASREIMLMNADGSQVQNLTNDTIKQWAPSWSKDGKTVYFLSETDSGQFVCSLGLKDKKLNTLHKLEGTVQMASISPDGKYITYAAERENKQAIYIWDINKRTELKLTGD